MYLCKASYNFLTNLPNFNGRGTAIFLAGFVIRSLVYHLTGIKHMVQFEVEKLDSNEHSSHNATVQGPDNYRGWQGLKISELRHDKTNKVTVNPAKTQICLGISPVCSVFAGHLIGSPSFLHADSEDSDQTEWIPRLI